MQSNQIAREMQRTYDQYFLSSGYSRRYPRPNAATLDYLLANGAREAGRILDFGCGNGRYSLALLAHSEANLIAYDISASSLIEFEGNLMNTPYRERVTFVYDDLSGLSHARPYDLILMLFGVLSHLGDRTTRIATLSRLRALVREDGRVILSVPSILRRRPRELFKCALARRLGRAQPPLNERGNICFTRQVDGHQLTFFYHLYALKDLRDELAAAGFAIRHCEAESVLPEWWVTQSRILGRVDRWLAAWIAPVLGYGIRVLAVPI
ncbi:methyltransferase domain-containing protein [Paraburkholderia sp. IMGN_8]|uniref:class I SAM-dependent methyltransferase n=1 Tax=Paraburkholderia sp. IMGN_8 TaxID=3136564 RepID=UPI003101A5F8